MARIRLLKVSGNYAPILHEGPLNRALARCPESDPWCAIARADYQLWMPAFAGADPAMVPEILRESPLLGPACARLAWASGELGCLATVERDGMGQGIQERGLSFEDPGTWVLNFGLSGAPGAGIGVLLAFSHPDLGWRQHAWGLRAWVDSRGGYFGSSFLQIHTGTALSPLLYAAGGRLVADRYEQGQRESYEQGTGKAGAGLFWAAGPLTMGVGGQGRADYWEGSWYTAHGPWMSITMTPMPWLQVNALGEVGFGSGETFLGSADLKLKPRLWGGTLAIRLGLWAVDGPPWREWTVGGSELLRGQPAGRYRGERVLPLQVEYRRGIFGPIQAALFLDTAWVEEDFYWTTGGGIRLLLPPEELNVTRLDVGFGEGSWGVVVAWGQAF